MTTDLTSGLDTAAFCTVIKPYHHQFRLVNGPWIDTYRLPDDKARYGSFDKLAEDAESQIRDILEDEDCPAAKSQALYRSFMDTDAIEAAGATPIRPALDVIDHAADKAALTRAIGALKPIDMGPDVFDIAVFGDPNFSFIAGRIKFVCLNTNAMEFDYSRPIPDFEFLAAQIRDREEEFDKTVVSMHIRPFCNEFNNNVAHVFQRYIKEFPGLQFCTSAHEHHRFEKDLFEDGIMYYMSDCMKNRNYYVFTITPEGYEREVVYF